MAESSGSPVGEVSMGFQRAFCVFREVQGAGKRPRTALSSWITSGATQISGLVRPTRWDRP